MSLESRQRGELSGTSLQLPFKNFAGGNLSLLNPMDCFVVLLQSEVSFGHRRVIPPFTRYPVVFGISDQWCDLVYNVAPNCLSAVATIFGSNRSFAGSFGFLRLK